MKKIAIVAAVIIAVIICGIFIINKMSPEKEEETHLMTVGLILNGSSDDRSWSQSHYDGLKETAEAQNIKLLCKEQVSDSYFVTAAEELIAQGCEIIICNSFGYGEYLDEITVKHPKIYFYHASGISHGGNLTTYFGRMYQIRYLCGIAAGLQTETNEIGYVAAFPISEVNRGINAFTLGARSVNPDVKVYESWTDSWVDDEAAEAASKKLIANHNIDILTMHVDSLAPLKAADEAGIFSIGYNYDNSTAYPDSCLTAAVWDWSNFYTPHIEECLVGKFRARNHWDGVNSGIVSLAPLSDKAKPGIGEKIEAERVRMENGIFDVFYGPIYDNSGTLRIGDEESMTDAAMLNSFDWYVDGVISE